MSPISLLLTISLISLLISPTLSLTFEQQLDATETSLRLSNYNLFGNAISTSDLRYYLISSSNSNASFTLFAPLDSTLYSLDMISPATTYIQTLYYHVVNGMYVIEDLQNVCYLDSLLRHYSVLVNQNAVNDTVVDGVTIALPNLFVGPRIVVHGLDGILVPGEVGFGELTRDSDVEFRRNLSPQASIEPDFCSPASSPASFGSPAMSPVSFESPASFESPVMSPVSFESPESFGSPAMSPMRFESPASFGSPVMSPMLSPEPESAVSPRSSPSRSERLESRSKSSKRKNRGKATRSKGRRDRRRGGRNGHDRHERFSKFIERHNSDF